MDQTADETREQTCYEKAKATGMPSFTLIAQDITADLCVDFWTMTQLRVRTHMDAGLTMVQAVDAVREKFGIPEYPEILGDAKLDGAARIAETMRAHSPRKLAD
jgi:hypothetical protein